MHGLIPGTRTLKANTSTTFVTAVCKAPAHTATATKLAATSFQKKD